MLGEQLLVVRTGTSSECKNTAASVCAKGFRKKREFHWEGHPQNGYILNIFVMILLLVISTSSNASEEDAAQQAVRSETMESYTKDEGKGKQGEQGGGGGAGDASGHGAEQVSAERVPLGRCMPPIPPAPNPRRGEMLMNNKQQQSKQGTGRAGRRQSHILVVSDTREGHPTKPMPKWKRGYIGFKRKVGYNFHSFSTSVCVRLVKQYGYS